MWAELKSVHNSGCQGMIVDHVGGKYCKEDIGVGRFTILGGPRGAKFPEVHDVVMTSMRRNDVASTSFRRHVPNRFLINQCQIITFLILKYDIIENSRIELRGIVLPVQVGGLLGGPKGMLPPPPSQIIGGDLAPLPPPLPTPMEENLRRDHEC